MKTTKRILSILLAMTMLFSTMGFTALAEDKPAHTNINVEIDGAKYAGEAAGLEAAIAEAKTSVVIESGEYCMLTINTTVPVTINGGTYTSVEDKNALTVIGSKKLIVNDGTYTSVGFGNALTVIGNSELIVNDGSFTSGWVAIDITDSTVTINDGTFISRQNAFYVTDSDVTIAGGTFDCAVVAWYAGKCSITVTNGELELSQYFFHTDDTENPVKFDIKDGDFKFEENFNFASGTVNADGEITGGTFKEEEEKLTGDSWTNYVPEGKIPELNEETGKLVIIEQQDVSIGDTTYSTLQDAIEEANNGDEIKLLSSRKEITTNNEYGLIEIPADKKVTINLNGKTLTGAFMVYGDATIKSGTILNKNKDASGIEAYGRVDEGKTGKLVTEDLTVRSARHAIRVDGGEATIKSGIYKSEGKNMSCYVVNAGDDKEGTPTKVIIEGGTFIPSPTASTQGTAIMLKNSAVTAEIKGGTFNSSKTYSLESYGKLDVTDGDFAEGVVLSDGAKISGGSFEKWDAATQNQYLDATKAMKLENGKYVVVDAKAEIEGGYRYASIQDAVDAAKTGDTINVYAGEHDAFYVEKEGLTIQAKPADEATVALEESKPVIKTVYEASPTWNVSAYNRNQALGCGGIEVRAANVTLKGLKLVSYGYGMQRWFAAPIGMYYEISTLPNGLVVDGCEIEFVGGEGDFNNNAIQLSGVTNLTVKDTKITGFENGYYGDTSGYATGAMNVAFTGNTIDASVNAISLTVSGKSADNGTVTVTNNTVLNGDIFVWDEDVNSELGQKLGTITVTGNKDAVENGNPVGVKVQDVNSEQTTITTDENIAPEYWYATEANAVKFAPMDTNVYVGNEKDYTIVRKTEAAGGEGEGGEGGEGGTTPSTPVIKTIRSLNIYANTDKVYAGDIVKVDVKIEDLDVAQARWDFAYDTSKFEVVGNDEFTAEGTIHEEITKKDAADYTKGSVLKTYTFKAKTLNNIDQDGIPVNFKISNTFAETRQEAVNNMNVTADTNTTATVTFPAETRKVVVKLDGEIVNAETLAKLRSGAGYTINYDGEPHNIDVVTEPYTDELEVKYYFVAEDGTETELTGAGLDLKKSGTYKIKYEVEALDGYGADSDVLTLVIGAPVFEVEVNTGEYYRADYVSGKKLVLVYTNAEGAYFTYDGKLMLDVTERGYKYNDVEEFEHVYAIVVDGRVNGEKDGEMISYADHKDKVHPIFEEDFAEDVELVRIDEYNTDMTFDTKVTLHDLTSIYSTFNANGVMFEDIALMRQILRADTDGNKYVNGVDTNAVVSDYTANR